MNQLREHKKAPLFNLVVYTKEGKNYRHTDTISWNQPYAICKANKNRYPKKHFQYLKIIKNGTAK